MLPGLNLQSPSPRETFISLHLLFPYDSQGHAAGAFVMVGLAVGDKVAVTVGETLTGEPVGATDIGAFEGLDDFEGETVGSSVGLTTGLEVGLIGFAVGEAKISSQQQL